MKKISPASDSAGSGTPLKETPQQTILRLTAHNAELEAQLKKHDTLKAQRDADEKVIAEKMAHGLSRHQAINVIRRQREFDAAPHDKPIASKPAKPEPKKK
jgi:hypothetical protein